MLLPPQQDLDRRRRIWAILADPLIDVVLDQGTMESDYFHIGQVAMELGYAESDLSRIYWKEVVPGVAGTWVWKGFLDAGWLEQRIRQPSKIGCLTTLLFCPWWIWVAWTTWRSMKSGFAAARTATNSTRRDLFDSIKEATNDHK